MSDLEKLGDVAVLQVHADLLKRPARFDPAPLVQVTEASLDSGGMLGWTGSAWIVDVHHRAWPGRGARRPLSVGFTSHYDKMRSRFREIPMGAAGENIIVNSDVVVPLDRLGNRIVIRGRDGGEAVLTAPTVAKPCLPFTSYMLDVPEVGSHEEIGEDLAFLDEGTRGFIFGVGELAEPFRVRVGDAVFCG